MNWTRVIFDLLIAGFILYLLTTGYLNDFLNETGL